MSDPAFDLGRIADTEHVQAGYLWRRGSMAFSEGLGLVDAGSRFGEEAHALSQDLGAYIQAAWHVLEPSAGFIPGWHLDAVAEHLEAVIRGEIQDLLINFPPRCMKSLSVVFWNTWTWTSRPWVLDRLVRKATFADTMARAEHLRDKHRWMLKRDTGRAAA